MSMEDYDKAELDKMDYEIAKALMDVLGKPVVSPRGRCFLVYVDRTKHRYSPTRRFSDATDALDQVMELGFRFRMSQNWDNQGADTQQTVFEIVTWQGTGLWGRQQVVASGVSYQEGAHEAIHESVVMAIHDFVQRGLVPK